MLILVLLSPFLIAIGWVLYVDSSNINMIEEFYKKNSCTAIYNYHSRYKGLCEDNITIINNQFSIDFQKNIYIKYDEIQSADLDGKDILIHSLESKEKLFFKEKIDGENFYENLKNRLK